jgi:hypothetical protein
MLGARGARPIPPGEAPATRVIFPPWVYKLPQSVDFNFNDFVVALGPNATVQPASLRFQLPTSQVGWIQALRWFMQASTTATDVTFILRINGAPVPGYTQANPPMAAAGILLSESEIQVPIPDSGVVSVSIRNNNANPQVVGAQIKGWYHPGSAEDYYWGARRL